MWNCVFSKKHQFYQDRKNKDKEATGKHAIRMKEIREMTKKRGEELRLDVVNIKACEINN